MTTMHVLRISAQLRMELNTFLLLVTMEINAPSDLAIKFWAANIPTKYVTMKILAPLILVPTEFACSPLLNANPKTARPFLVILALENVFIPMLIAMTKTHAP
jgi:hypothetical protein